MLFYFSRGLGSRFQTVLDSFGHQADNPLINTLSESGLERIAAEEGVDFGNHPDDVYTPSVTLWAWLTQVLSGSKSCVAAVARVVTLMAGSRPGRAESRRSAPRAPPETGPTRRAERGARRRRN